jgi:hypothetical protein
MDEVDERARAWGRVPPPGVYDVDRRRRRRVSLEEGNEGTDANGLVHHHVGEARNSETALCRGAQYDEIVADEPPVHRHLDGAFPSSEGPRRPHGGARFREAQAVLRREVRGPSRRAVAREVGGDFTTTFVETFSGHAAPSGATFLREVFVPGTKRSCTIAASDGA